MEDIVLTAGKKIVEAEDIMLIGKKPFAEMRTQKTGTAGNQYTHDECLQE